jgi:DNA-binding transcriptional LysR family regulator
MLEIESIDEIFKNKKQKLKGELVVGCQEGLSWCLTPRVIAELSCRHPDLKVITKTTWMDSRYAALESGEVDILVTFLVNETAPSVYNAAVLCQPGTVAMMRQGHPLDNGKKVHLKELAKYEQVMINDGPGFNLFHAMYEERGLNPERMSMSNISTSAQSIVGCSDAVSLRILKPAHHLSPLGDEIVYPALADKVKGPDIVAITHKARSSANALKQEVFISLCQELFSSGKMREHMVY